MKHITLITFVFLPCVTFSQLASSILPDSVKKTVTRHQVDLIDVSKKAFHIRPSVVRTQGDKKLYFSVLPSTNVPDGSGRALVTSTTAGTYLGPRKTTNLSSATFAPYWNFGRQFGLPLRTSVWFPNNTLTIQGDIRFLRYPEYTWGLGSTTNNDNKTLVDYNYIRFYQSVLKPIRPYLFAGIGYDLDYHSKIHSNDIGVDLTKFTNYNYGTDGKSLSSGVTFNLLYDTRNNSINPLPGAYANVVFRVNPQFLGSDDNWRSLYIDLRKYIPLNPWKPTQQNTLALWSYLWSSFGNVPYLDLPSVGWDPYNRSGRGIEQNRYRGKTMFYFEGEYRRDITDNGLFGFVIFGNINSVSGTGNLFTAWHPAAGTGLRIKFNKGSGTNLGIDYGFSNGYGAILLNLGEAF
jgi:hypothetical protein